MKNILLSRRESSVSASRQDGVAAASRGEKITAGLFLLAALLASASASGAGPDWVAAAGVTVEEVAEPVFGGHVKLYRAGVPGRDPVVLIHGLGQSGARDWAKVIPHLARRHSVYALDLPGFGGSTKGNHLYSPHNFTRVIEAVVAPRLPRFALVGHSMGAAVSLAYAAAYPDRVSRLVLVDIAGVLHRSVYAEYLSRLGAHLAVGVYPRDAPWFDNLVRTVLTRMDAVPLKSEVVLGIPALRQRMLRGDPNAIAAYALVEHDFSHALRSVRAPTLVVWGALDRVAPLRTGQLAAATIRGATLAVLDGVGHTPMVEAPEKLSLLLDEALGGATARAPYAMPLGHPFSPGTAARCNGESGRSFTGDYAEIVLQGCADAVISRARTGRLVAHTSSLRILDSEVLGSIEATDSRIEITAGRVRAADGHGALILDATELDAAGTGFSADSGILVENRGRTPLRVSLSVVEWKPGSGPAAFLHEVARLPGHAAWPARR